MYLERAYDATLIAIMFCKFMLHNAMQPASENKRASEK